MTRARYGGPRRDPFTLISKTTVNDNRLSFKARGLLVWLLDKPDDWTTSIDRLSRTGPDGTYAIRSALKELEQFGYLARHKSYDPQTGYKVWEYVWYEKPQVTSTCGNPTMDKPADGLPDDGKSDDGETARPNKNNSTKKNYEEVSTNLAGMAPNPQIDDPIERILEESRFITEDVNMTGLASMPIAVSKTATEILDNAHDPGAPKLTPMEQRRLKHQVMEWLQAGHAPDAIRAAIASSQYKTANAIGGLLRKPSTASSRPTVGEHNMAAAAAFLQRHADED